MKTRTGAKALWAVVLYPLLVGTPALAQAGIGFSHQVVTTQAPASTGCVQPTAATSFLTTDNTVYLYFEATVTTSDSLTNNWLAPDGTVVAGIGWASNSGHFCFPGASLSISSLPISQLGSWQARVYDNGTLLFSVPFTVAAAQTTGPTITTVSNAATHTAGVAPNSWVEIKGSNLAPPNDSRVWQGSDFVNNQMPTQLDGVGVTMNGENAYMYFASPGQVNVLTPADLASGQVQVKVTTGGATSAAFAAQAQEYLPTFFLFGPGPYVVGTHAPVGDLGPTSLYPGLTTPAAPGEEVVLYATGFGPISPPVVAGSAVQWGSLPVLPIVKIGGLSAFVAFAGLVTPGLYQFNVVVPVSVPNGDNTLIAQYAGFTTQSGVLLTVQNPNSGVNPTLTITTSGTGSGTVGSSPAGTSCGSGCQSFAAGTVVALTATANTGSTFAGWSGACLGTGSCSVTMSSNQAVTAAFNLTVNPTLTISISPAAATIQTGETQQFTAAVTGATNSAVTWSVNGAVGGNPSIGTILSSGLYTAPTSVPSPNTVAIAATSVANPAVTASATLLINPACQVRASAMTDANGSATLCAGGFILPIQLTDVDSGNPLVSGLAVSAAVDPTLPGRAVVLIADPGQNYPLQFVLLNSQSALEQRLNSLEGTAGKKSLINGSTIAIPTQSGTATALTAVFQALQTGILGLFPPPQPNAQSFANSFLTAVQEMKNNPQLFLPPPLSGALPSVTTSSSIPIGQYQQNIVEQLTADEKLTTVLWMVTLSEDPLELFGGLAQVINSAVLGLATTNYYQKLGASNVVVETISFGGFAVQFPAPVFVAPMQNIYPPNPNLSITAQNPSGSPVASGLIQLISSDALGLGFLAEISSQGLATIAAPPGNYTARIDSSGFQSQTQNVTVSDTGITSLNFVLQPLPSALTSLRLAPLGSAGPGSATLTGPGGTPVTGILTFSGPVQAGGVNVTISVDNSAAQLGGSYILVSGGQSSATFTINTSTVTVQTVVHISATMGSVVETATLTLAPPDSVSPTSISLGSVGGCAGGSVSGFLNVTAAPGVKWTWPPNTGAGDPTLTFSPASGTGSAVVTVTDTQPPQAPPPGSSCSNTQLLPRTTFITLGFSDGSSSAQITVNYSYIYVAY
jgi:uncharacterized protein (TIGR03437 family)